MNSNIILSKIIEGIPHHCRVISSTEYEVAIPEQLHLHHSRLYANCSELSHHKDIESVNVSFYKHSGNCVYTIEVTQNYDANDEDDCDNWEL